MLSFLFVKLYTAYADTTKLFVHSIEKTLVNELILFSLYSV